MFPRHRPAPDKTRIARFLAKGYPVRAVAAAEKLGPEEMTALLGEQGFRGLVDWFRRLHALPPEERLQRLVRHAMEVLEEALLAGNLRAGSFIVAENKAGRHPASTLARRVAACLDAVPPEPSPGRRPPGPPRGPTLAPGSRPDTRQLVQEVELRELVATSVAQNGLLHKLDEAAAEAPAATAPQTETVAGTAPSPSQGDFPKTAPQPVTAPSEPVTAAPPKSPRRGAKPAPEPRSRTEPPPPFVPGMAFGLGTPVYAARAP
jgi:hypothetical protein